MFADIKGSTELEQDLDPEEARAIIDPALKLMIDAAHQLRRALPVLPAPSDQQHQAGRRYRFSNGG